MKVFYHSDIVPEVYTAFTAKMSDPGNTHMLVESLCAHRLENMKVDELPKDNGPAAQAALTVQGYFMGSRDFPGFDTNVEVFEYLPEKLNDEGTKNMILDLCRHGKFVPFIVGFSKEDLAKDAPNVMVFIAGIGDNPECNFMVVTINLPSMAEVLGISYDGTNDDIVHLTYPIVFDAVAKVIGSTLPKDKVAVRTFIMSTEETKANDTTD